MAKMISRRFLCCSPFYRLGLTNSVKLPKAPKFENTKEKFENARETIKDAIEKSREDQYIEELKRELYNSKKENAKVKVAELRDRSQQNVQKYKVVVKEKREENVAKFNVRKEEFREKGKELKEKGKEKSKELKEKGIEKTREYKERAKRENWYTIPNAISASRIAVSPVIFNLIMSGNYELALYLNLFSAVSDFLDGKIARTWPSQQSTLGTALDPLADKITMLFIYSAFYLHNDIPGWLFMTIIGRDIALIIGTSIVRYQTLPPPKTLGRYFDFGLVSVKLNPTWVSKTNTLIQFILPIWLMANSSGYLGSGAVVDMSTNLFFGLTLSTTLISTAEYFIFRRDLLTGKPVLTTLKNMTK